MMTKKTFFGLDLLLAAALMLSGCGSQADTTSTSAGSAAAQDSTTATATESVYKSDDGWQISYDSQLMSMSEDAESVTFTYTGEASGDNTVSIKYAADKEPQAVLDEETAGMDETNITSSDGTFGSTDANAITYSITGTDEAAGTYTQLSAIEFNGGTLLVSIDMHTEDDEATSQAISDAIEGLVDTLTFTK